MSDARLVSGEGVALQLSRAGVGSRIVATLVDLLLQVFGGVMIVSFSVGVIAGADEATVATVVLTEVVLVLAGYPILCEWLGRGRTLGKLALGLRVVRDDGGPIGFRQALVRGLASLVLEKPGLLWPISTAAGLLTALFGPDAKRLGDLMAGTLVINERGGPWLPGLQHQFFVPPQLQPWAQVLDLSGLDDRLALSVRQFVVRANGMTPAAQHALGEDLRARVEAVISPPAPPGTPTPWLLATVLAEHRRRSEPTTMPSRSRPGRR